MRRKKTAIKDALLFWRRPGKSQQAGGAPGTDELCVGDLVELAFEGVAVVEGGRVVEANRAFASTFGYEASAVVGKTLAEFVAPESRALVEKSISAGNERPYEAVGLKSDGTPLKVEMRARRSSYEDRDLHLVGVRDVTGLREAEEQLGRAEAGYRALVEQIPAVTYTQEPRAGHHFASMYLSPQAERMFGYKPEEFASDPGLWRRLIHPGDRERVLAEDERTDETGEFFEAEYRLLTGDGRVLWVRDEAVLVRDEEGRPLYWQGVMTDVTARKRAEEALKESEQRYADLLSSIRAYVYRCLNEPDWPNEYASDYALELTGYRPEDLLVSGTVRFGDLIVEEDRQRVWDKVQAALEKREQFRIRYTIVQRDGTHKHVEEFGRGVYDEEGNVEAIEGIVYDVTELKQAEEKAREIEVRYRILVEQIPAVTYMHQAGETDHIPYVSPQTESMLGYKPEEYTSDPDHWIKIMHPADRERVLAEDRRTGETGEPFRVEYRQFAKDGRVVWVRDEAVLVRDEEGRPLYWLGVQYDITERKEAEKALKESELRLRTVISNVPVVLFAFNHAGTITLSEGKGLSFLGLEPGELVGRSVSEIFGDTPEILEDVDRALAGEEFSAVREVGSGVFETWYSPLRASTSEVTGVISVAINITERKRAEETLRESEAGLAEAQRIVHLGNWEWDVVADEMRWSDEVFRIYGFAPRAFVPTLERLFEAVHPNDRELLKAAIDGALNRGEPHNFEHRIIRPDGEERVVHRRGEVMRDEKSGKPLKMIGTVHDITERKKAEEDIKEANKRLEELADLRAEFTAMVAHEIGSPLGAIRGFLEMLATGELDADGQANAIAKIQTEIDRLSTLTADIRSAAAAEQDEFDLMLRQTTVGELLEDAAAFAGTLPGGHPLVVEGTADGRVRADPYRIGQVLRNLLSNAAKYSPDGAPIELRTSPGETPGHIRIEVGDHGRGVHPDDAVHIFEKFGRGHHRSGRESYGVGLGLYVSRRIVRAHGSELKLAPAPGGGSIFSFELETQ